jgi:GNAT superfamily N-acetyltransferase
MTSPVRLLLNFHAAAGLPFPTTAAWADKLYMTARTDPNWLCVERPGGILLAQVGPSPLGPFLAAQEIAWWVEPDVRGIGMGMLKEYEEWAIRKGAKAIEMKSLAIFPETEKIYEHLGYKRLEISWVKWQFSQA